MFCIETYMREIDIIHETKQPFVALGNIGAAMFPF